MPAEAASKSGMSATVSSRRSSVIETHPSKQSVHHAGHLWGRPLRHCSDPECKPALSDLFNFSKEFRRGVATSRRLAGSAAASNFKAGRPCGRGRRLSGQPGGDGERPSPPAMIPPSVCFV